MGDGVASKHLTLERCRVAAGSKGLTKVSLDVLALIVFAVSVSKSRIGPRIQPNEMSKC